MRKSEEQLGKFKYLNLKLPPDEKDFDGLWHALETYQEKAHKLSTRQDPIRVEIQDKSPVILAFLADLHIGAVSGRYGQMRSRIDLIADTPHCYMISCGATTDNYLPQWHASGQFEEICPPELQKRLIEYIFSRLGKRRKVLALVQGCHDEASHITDYFDFTKYLGEKLEVANLEFGGLIQLLHGTQHYDVYVRHKYRFGSSFNLTHTVKRMREQLGDFDIGVVAHNHQAAIEQLPMSDKSRIFIRPGSFKGTDRYARQLGFVDTGAQVPSVIIYPDRRKMLPFLNLADAVTVLNNIQKVNVK